MLGVVSLALVLALTTWFSAAATAPQLAADWGLSAADLAWLTNGVQIGFVAGALGASALGLPDIVAANRLTAAGSAVVAAANAVLLLEPSLALAVASRLVLGAALALVYPPALKLVATWFVARRGLALGTVTGAVAFGSALPHLFNVTAGGFDWRLVMIASSLSSLLAAGIFLLFAADGPYRFESASFDPRQIGRVLADRPVMLAMAGYFGHMWEIYAMWTWLVLFVNEALAAADVVDAQLASLIAFGGISVGTVGCFLGGWLSDRVGRTATSGLFLLVSGGCAIAAGFVFGGPPWLLVAFMLVWGVAVTGDSAQFSTAVTELSAGSRVGTALSLQIGLGFALTTVSIALMPYVAALLGGWRWVFAVLAVGPAIGVLATVVLRRMPASLKMAAGRR
ncbi:MFS transporter [Acuticoccus sp. 2012]|uniref:MFS transporter n=2 Tax=Acuticoccus mangrovi TaxID=2796142 RepID=A0A934MI20_9HYPH|nr:MFS transporter [Acuticoccus mangrovi]MBJ3776711.1 MFS transporter [Acuticoccus mangrovi]